MANALDHLVIAARTLDEGVAWCGATLGVVPGPGGRHALMGTHNRVLPIGCAAYPAAYAEIIAIDPAAPEPGRARWFDLDTRLMRECLAGGPSIVHWVMRCDDIDILCDRWRSAGIDRGEVVEAQRDTPEGMLRWRITVRKDGARLFDGALPTLIEWGDRHPAQGMVDAGVQLCRLEIAGVPSEAAPDCAEAGATIVGVGAALRAVLDTPRGRVVLMSNEPGHGHVRS